MKKRKTNKKKDYVVASIDMLPFPITVLFIAGNWHNAAKDIDKLLCDNLKKTKPSDYVFNSIRREDFDNETCLGMTIRSEEIIIIVIRDVKAPINTLVHECLHAVMGIIDTFGVSDHNHETEAYLLERLVEECVKAANKRNNNLN